MIRRAVIGLFAVVALLLLLACLLVYGLVGTSPGNRWLLTQVSNIIPGELQVDDWQGNLLGPLSLSGIRYRNETVNLELDQLNASLKPTTLPRGWLTFEFLSLGNLRIQTGAVAQSEKTGNPLPDSLILPIGIRIEQLAVESVQLNDTQWIRNLEGESLSAWRRFQIARLDALLMDDLQLNVSGHGQLSSPYPIDSRIRWQQALPENEQINTQLASGELTAQGPLTALRLNHDLLQPLRIHSRGDLQYRDAQWQVALLHEWQAQPLPLKNDDGLTLDDGKLLTHGPLAALQIQGQTALRRQSPNQEPQKLEIKLDSILGGQTLNIAELTLRQSRQRLTGKGSVQLNPLKWDLALSGSINTGIFSPQLEGQLDIDGHSQGQLEGKHWQLESGTITATGTLRQQPLRLKAQTKGNADNLHIDSTLQWGDNRLQLTGKAWPQWQLNGQLTLNSLAQLDNRLQGSISGNLKIQGKPQSPRFSGQLTGSELSQSSMTLATINAVFKDLGIGPQPQQLNITLSDLTLAGQPALDTANLDLQGTIADHQLLLDLQQGDTSLHSQLDGALSLAGGRPPAWRGALSNTRLAQDDLGEWLQVAATDVSLTASKQTLGELCLRQQDSQLCADGTRQGNHQLALNARIDALPLALFSFLLGQDYSLEGTLHGQAHLEGSLDTPRGEINLRTEQAKLNVNVQDGPPPWQLDTLALDTQLDGKQAHTRLTLVSALGQVNADLTHGFSADAAMAGQASFQVERLSIIEMLTADLRDVSGKLNGDVQLGGTPRAPVIEGTLALRDGYALVPALGTAVSKIDLSLQGSPQGRLTVAGQALMGSGTVKVDGYLDPARWPLALSLHFTGQRLLVTDRPDARVWVSPDLNLKGDLGGMMLSGRLTIPEAAIHPEQLPEGAVTVSEDQILVHQEGNASQRFPLSMDVTVTLGDKVSFNGFGLNATLGGNLQILQEPQQPPQLNGELVVVEGRYRAYGQNLAISDGQLIFQGQPDNPGLDIRAYRKIPSEAITVGVQLGGTLQRPEATLYSDPGMEPSQIMSYLLTGRPLEGGTQNDANRIAQALAVYGLEKGSGVTEKIGDRLGVDEITVGSDWETEDASLMLGKQLSDRLYLTYAIGLFDAVSTVMLRYTLTRSLHLEARSSSEANSLDLIWEKELR